MTLSHQHPSKPLQVRAFVLSWADLYKALRSLALIWMEMAPLLPPLPWQPAGHGAEGLRHSIFKCRSNLQPGFWQMILMKSSCLMPVNRIVYAAFCPNGVKSEDGNFI